MLHFIFISTTFFTLYKLLKLRRESYPRILSSKNKFFPPLTASLSRNGNRTIVADKFSKFQGMYTCKKVVKIVFHYHLYFLGISKVYNILHQWSVDRIQSKECYYMYTYTLSALFILFIVFHQKFYVFVIFISFFDKYQISSEISVFAVIIYIEK